MSAALSSSVTWSVVIMMKMMDNSSLGKVYDKVNYVNHYYTYSGPSALWASSMIRSVMIMMRLDT